MASILEGGQVDTLVFDAALEPFRENAVMIAALAVHADLDAMFFGKTVKASLAS